jgi:polyferredoxin
MAIYDLSKTKDPVVTPEEGIPSSKDRFFSSLTARLLFLVLLVGDVLWAAYSFSLVALTSLINLLTFFKLSSSVSQMKKRWIALKRSAVCGVALLVSLFSPALGIMIACTYFLMYDKTGIQEVVPTSLQDQFQEFLK